jgi:ATP-dependent Lon protease
MGKVAEHLLNLITKQVEDNGIVVWYDPEKTYTGVIETPSIPETIVLRYEDSFFSLCAQIEPLQIGMDNGARRALIPIENKRHFLEVSADIMERVDPIFYGDPLTAAMKALGLN